MTSIQPLASVVIPTHNRRYSLARTLDSLGSQTAAPGSFEVIVVADGCRDGTQEMLADYRADYPLVTISQEGKGSSVARNVGAARAEGDLIIFLDDDILASPGFIEAHRTAHQKFTECATIGYFALKSETPAGLFRIALNTWWEKLFDQMREIGHRFSCNEVVSGNFSISKETFRRIKGFDPSLEVHEDYELGMRLIKEKVPIVFEPEALGYHYQATDLKGAFMRKFQEGKADVMLGRLYPELRPTLLMNKMLQFPGLYNDLISGLAFHVPLLSDLLAKIFATGLGILEWLRLRWFWRRLLDVLMAYWYWRGVAKEMRSLAEVKRFLGGPALPQSGPEIDLDLSIGLEAAERLLDQARPASVAIRYGPHLVGWIPAKPGAERLRGVHLRRILAVDLRPAFWRVLVQAGGDAILGLK